MTAKDIFKKIAREVKHTSFSKAKEISQDCLRQIASTDDEVRLIKNQKGEHRIFLFLGKKDDSFFETLVWGKVNLIGTS